ncbi:MAG: tRNA uridine-5-carboxymethylaminomethyl(34) synthesis enzyme MnmG, partial [Clostridia bacterium]|nr:tRNA uridine-5-carboxymethylaminomethyl(34) synthesis enzyme MnmG [Clostridia bacterium]
TMEKQQNLLVRQAEIVSLEKCEEGYELTTSLGAVFVAKSVVLATGTFLKGKIFVGEVNYDGGPDGTFAATTLSESLLKLGLPLRRFKTGTPARVLRSSINFENLERQDGDEKIIPFSFENENPPENTVSCHIAYTNDKTKEVILNNLDRSPLYGGVIEGVGPRYCPSIEDKIVRFADKKRHQLFIEPCGKNTEEMYLQGMSSSLPEEVQLEFYRTIEGLEKVEIMRPAYAIEYDCVDPLSLFPTLEVKNHKGLFGAGQFNGSSGYEEAAAQGLIAGINAAKFAKGEELFHLTRSSSYIGTLIDDLVTKGCADPYRMMTSRSEYRLILRQNNADERLTPIGYEIGLISEERYNKFKNTVEIKEREIERLENTFASPSAEINEMLEKKGTVPLSTGVRLADLIRRPQLSINDILPFDNEKPDLSEEILDKIETELKYSGYIKRQLATVKEMHRMEATKLDVDTPYNEITGLRLEAREKLLKVKPLNIGQAMGISGVSPADISVLIIWLQKKGN